MNLSKKSNLTQKDTEIISKMRKDKEEIETKIDGLSFKNLNNQYKNKVIRLEKQMEKFYKDKINTLHYQKLNLEKEIEFCEYKIDKNSNRDVNLYINNMNEFISSKNEEKKLIELEIEKIKNSNSLENLERMTLDKLNGNDSYTTMMMSYINLDKIIKEKELENKIHDSIIKYSKMYQVDPCLIVAMMKQESGFLTSAVSKEGAIGLMQLMPGTAEEMNINPFMMEENIRGGILYMSRCLKMNNGDIALALAAYNAGSGNVRKYDSIPPFEETQNYIFNTLKIYNGEFNKNYVHSPVEFKEDIMDNDIQFKVESAEI